ncbi:unnamed protein product [Protopolystoma xenopodis]|uniref:Uncharacterized protein n=1 Tax=Protopolystoma xenopodis TaxID=117903 RepID=A0A448X307_9PLAT|nr:unnamed protein product [Protopolystoma xenopodis]
MLYRLSYPGILMAGYPPLLMAFPLGHRKHAVEGGNYEGSPEFTTVSVIWEERQYRKRSRAWIDGRESSSLLFDCKEFNWSESPDSCLAAKKFRVRSGIRTHASRGDCDLNAAP